MMNKLQKGFTLIEVLITVAIIGILGAIAYPSYSTFVTKSNRAEPQKELLELANLMEQYFIDHRTYTNKLTLLGKSADSYDTDSGNYTISVSASDTTTFTINAAIKTGSSQASDSTCSSMSVNNTGKKKATSNSCWEK